MRVEERPRPKTKAEAYDHIRREHGKQAALSTALRTHEWLHAHTFPAHEHPGMPR